MSPTLNSQSPSRLSIALKQFNDDEKHQLLHLGDAKTDITVIGLGAVGSAESLAQSAHSATKKLQQIFGGKLTQAFSGLKIYFGDGIIKGGEAFPAENALVIDATKGKMTVSEAEKHLVGMGALEAGDWTNILAPDVTYAELTIIHELGHLLEAKTHGAQGVAFEGLNHADAPTKYGRDAGQKPGPNNEDYAESFVYKVYGADINKARSAILRKDIQAVAKV